MHCYETIYILHPDLGEEAEQAAKERVAGVVAAAGGRVYHKENWGKKRLAYDVRKQNKGVYQLVRFIGNAAAVAELERQFRLDESFLKFLTIRLKADPATIGDSVTESGAPQPQAVLSSDDDDED
ncbi:MAG: 30S ribosomal protein S6 [Nitrospirae bacterium]|nr:30S ribosomal protein S6 [Nitrospirota bacterium]